jgi:signal peptidase II
MKHPKRWIQLLIRTLLLVGLDQGSKQWILGLLDSGKLPWYVTSWFTLTYAKNTGISFGWFKTQSPWIFALLSCAIVTWLALWYVRTRNTWERGALTLLIGGAVGNMIDRLLRAGVIDFIDVHAGEWHFPAFNAADAFITTGVLIIIIELLWTTYGRKRHA